MENIQNIENMGFMEGESCMLNTPPFPAVTPVAMAYIPFQQFGTLYEPEKGMSSGTIFPELDKPFLAGRGVMK